MILVYVLAVIGALALIYLATLLLHIILTEPADAPETDTQVIEIRNYDI